MKKHLLVLGVALTALVIARLIAGPFSSQSLINGQAIVVEQPASATALAITATNTAIKYTNDLGQIITAGTNAGGITYGTWSRAVAIRGNAIGDAAQYTLTLNIPASANGTSNTVTVTLERSVDGTNYDQLNTWAGVTTAVATNARTTLITNVPTAFTTGAAYIRAGTISFATNVFGYTNYIDSLRLGTFAP